MEDNTHTVKREEASNNDPENGSPDADRGGTCPVPILYTNLN